MANYVGIDFGTSNSVVASFDGSPRVLCRDEKDVLPSVVAARSDGTLVIGHEAKLILTDRNGRRSVKRILGRRDKVRLLDQEYRTEEIATLIFARLKAIAEENLGEPVTHAVITVPANSKGAQRHATGLAASIAGLQVITLINEPTAAAMAYGLDSNSEQTVLVYDFGGGTFDVTILKLHNGVFEELASKGVAYLGGDDIDQALLDDAARLYRAERGSDLMATASGVGEIRYLFEQAKIRLSSESTASVWLEKAAFRYQISVEEYRYLIEGFIERTREPMETALDDAGLEKDDIDVVLMVGGSSRIPAVRDFVRNFFGRDIIAEGVDPMTCVAQGAAIAAAIVRDAEGMEDYAYSVKLEHSLCADPYDPEVGQVVLSPIIRRGRDIPCKDSQLVYPVEDFAEAVSVGIYEGDVYDNPADPENVKLGTLNVPLRPPRPAREAALLITYRYDVDGILTVSALDKAARKTYDKAVRYAGAELSPEEFAELSRRTEKRLAASRAYPDAAFALQRYLERVRPSLGPDDDEAAGELASISSRLMEAMEDADESAIQEVTAELNDELGGFSYLF